MYLKLNALQGSASREHAGSFFLHLAGCRAEREGVSEEPAEVRDALEDLVEETVGAVELTEDYSTCRDSCRTHAHTRLLQSSEKASPLPTQQCSYDALQEEDWRTCLFAVFCTRSRPQPLNIVALYVLTFTARLSLLLWLL